MSPPRVALYGHDTVGLGHLRRNLALAAALSQSPERPDVLVVTGAIEAVAYDLPPAVDLLLVPGVRKDDSGRYGARRFRGGLDAVLALRQAAMSAALEEFAPDLLVIDKVPYGLGGELRAALNRLRFHGRTRVVLGLRDVLDEPRVARAEWRRDRFNDALRHHIDEVWVYGDRSVHDLGEACAVPPALRQRFRYTGYLSAGRVTGQERPPAVDERSRYVLCTVGGGQDGSQLARTFATAAFPTDVVGVLVSGPQMSATDRAALERLAAGRRDLVMTDFSPSVDRWIAGADAVVSMGGYNTVSEILSTSTPALVVPRCQPRAEQAVRAEALCRRGHVDCLDPDALDRSALSAWIADAVERPTAARSSIDLDGLSTVARLASSFLTSEPLHATAG